MNDFLKKAEEEVKELEAQFAAQSSKPEENEVPKDVAPDGETHSQETAASEGNDQNAPEPEPAKASVMEETDSLKKAREADDRKMQIYKGRLKAEIKRNEKNEQEARRMAERVAQLEAMVAQKQQPPVEDTSVFDSLAEDMSEPTVRKIQAVIGKEVSKRDEKWERKFAELDQQRVHEQERLFFAELSGMVPDYAKLNNDPKFIEWLEGTTDDIDDETYLEKLRKSKDSLDAGKVARFFNKYKQATSGTTTTGTDKRAETVKKMQAPGRSKTGTSQSATPEITEQSLNARYDKLMKDVRSGKLSTTEFEKREAALQKDYVSLMQGATA